jgi:nucleotide-binding universal stress UspA family protein
VFASVLCGIDGSRTSLEAARQAGVLARGGRLRLLAVTWEQGTGATAVAVLSRWRAERCLDRARQDLRELDVEPLIELVDDPQATERLLREAEQHDLLVVASHGRSRPGGILTGSTASTALHRATVPLLVARRPPGEARFPDRILLALDGTEPSRAAARVAAQLARRHGSEVAVIASADHDPARRRAVSEDVAAILAATGTEPVVLGEHGPAHRAIAAAAADAGSSLVVTGSRGRAGAAALQSVSERIGHEAPCSVLVVRSQRAQA